MEILYKLIELHCHKLMTDGYFEHHNACNKTVVSTNQ